MKRSNLITGIVILVILGWMSAWVFAPTNWDANPVANQDEYGGAL